MPGQEKKLTEEQRKAVAFLTRPPLRFEPAWYAAREAAAQKEAIEEDARARATAKAGDMMPDGTVCAGISPDTKERMYTTPHDASPMYTFDTAREYASRLEAHGHRDWRVPSENELNVLFNNRAVIGGFKLRENTLETWYWSSSEHSRTEAKDQRFSDGERYFKAKALASSLRCVR